MGHHGQFRIIAGGLLLLLAACGGTSGETSIVGSVVFLEQEGGIYGVVGDDGTRYEPVDLPSEFRVDGMRIRFRLRALGAPGEWGDRAELFDVAATDAVAPGRRVVVDGTVTYVDLEGGFFGILGDDGNEYDPLDLPTRFAVDGLRVSIEARVRQDLASAHMWGALVELDEIVALP